MLDINYYRSEENRSRNSLSCDRSYFYRDMHKVSEYTFNITNIHQLVNLLESYHGVEFSRSMVDLNIALSNFKDSDFLLDVCKNIQRFQKVFFQRITDFPIKSVINTYILFLRLNIIKPQFESIIEIGPGGGHLSFFLREHKHLYNYSYYDVTESYYILQNQINTFLFQEEFVDFIFEHSENKSFYDEYSYLKNWGHKYSRFGNQLEFSRHIRCAGFPWWKKTQIKDSTPSSFDFVVFNGNTGMPSPDLREYFALARDILKEDGMIVMHAGMDTKEDVERVWGVALNEGFCIKFLHRGNRIDMSRIVNACKPFYGQDVIIAPASVSVSELLLEKQFVEQFSSISLYDDIKEGSINGYPIIKLDEIKERKIVNLILICSSDELENDLMSKLAFMEHRISLSRRQMYQSLCIFIKDTHPKFKEYFMRDTNFDFMPCGVHEIDSLASTLCVDDKQYLSSKNLKDKIYKYLD